MPALKTQELPNFLVIFDSECLLCQGAIKFLMTYSDPEKVRICSLANTKKILGEKNLPDVFNQDSLVLFCAGDWYTRGQAVRKIAARLKSWPRVFYWLLSVSPLAIANRAYDFIARHRNTLFGRTESCFVPSTEQRGFFWPRNET